jgi:hypothetical protein
MKRTLALVDKYGSINPVTKFLLIITSPTWILFALLIMLALGANVLEIDLRPKRERN